MAGLYVHVPFCIKKCPYCSFNSYDNKLCYADDYVKKLASEIKKYQSLKVDTVYFGGGTPTVLNTRQLVFILDTIVKNLKVSENAEITIEANPGTCDFEKLLALRKSGFNRMSLGLQSMNDGELSEIGRLHTAREGINAVLSAKKAGFENISGDIMTAIPHQTIKSLEGTVKTIISLGLSHVSAYSLSIEEGTPFYSQAKNLVLPDEETEREMYYLVTDTLKSAGYVHYEISNYALPGFESRHNTGYWTGRDYVGVGAGAHSLYKNKRFSNVCDICEYICSEDTVAETQVLDEKERKKEYYMLGLRRMCGVRDDGNPKIDDLVKKGLLEREGDIVSLTRKGIDLSNYVFRELM